MSFGSFIVPSYDVLYDSLYSYIIPISLVSLSLISVVHSCQIRRLKIRIEENMEVRVLPRYNSGLFNKD